MASLLPLIHDILPMIMPSSISITKGSSLLPEATAQGEEEDGGPKNKATVIRRDAIVSKSDRMCASVMVVKPKEASTVRHHGEQDAIIYVASGKGTLLTNPRDEGQEPERHELVKGDFAFVPCWTEHQAANESDDEDLVWIITRGGSRPVEVTLMDWGGDEIRNEN